MGRVRDAATAPAVMLAIAATATADLTEVRVELTSALDGLTTFRISAQFDATSDRLLAVGACDGIPLQFLSTVALHNEGGAFNGLALEDLAGFPLSGARDSWVTIGHDQFAGNDTALSSGLFGGDGETRVIEGDALFDRNGGWYDAGQPPGVSGGSILIAQFTFPSQPESFFALEGCVTWSNADGNVTSTPFLTAPHFGCCPEDLDGDDQVDFADLLILLSNWGPCREACNADLDGSGDVGIGDLTALLSEWGAPCCK